MKTNMLTPYGARVFIIKVDTYDDKIIKGRISHARLPVEESFNGFIQMALAVEEILDTEECPQNPNDPNIPTLKDNTDPGATATLIVEILFRQNSSWQGRLTWTDEKQEATFRSALELMILIDEALGA
jgi:hypothetical protein